MPEITVFTLIVLFALYVLFDAGSKEITEEYRKPELYPAAKESKHDDKKSSVCDFVNQVICADCLEFLRGLEDSCVDLFVTSPPYNLKNSSGNGMKDGRGGKWSSAALLKGYEGYGDAMPYEDYCAWQRECLSEMMRLLKDDGAIFYNHKWRVQNGILQDRHEILHGFPVRQIIIWKRKGGINFNAGYFLPTYEVIYLITKPKFKLAEKANRLGDVWEIKQEMNNPHPAPYPEELTDRIISSTNARLVIDPFAGSGTTAMSAKRYGRDYIMIERSHEYCEMIKARIEGKNWNEKKAGKKSK